MTAINLMLGPEQDFGVRFPDAMLDQEVFRSPRHLAAAIRTLLQERSPGGGPGAGRGRSCRSGPS